MVVRRWKDLLIQVGQEGVRLVAYADDILLIANRQSDMAVAVSCFEDALTEYDLSYDAAKCQLLTTFKRISLELQRFPNVKAKQKENAKPSIASLSHLGVRMATTPRKTILANIQALSHLNQIRGLLYHFDISDRLWITLIYTLSRVLYTFTPLAMGEGTPLG
jgi:hypothetical protein